MTLTIDFVVALSAVVIVIGALAFLVSVTTELTKGLGFLAKIPTNLQVIVTSLALCLISYFAYTSIASVPLLWYCVVGAIIGSFIISLISIRGWKVVIDILRRFINMSVVKDINDLVDEATKK
jgi:hypothetical protein